MSSCKLAIWSVEHKRQNIAGCRQIQHQHDKIHYITYRCFHILPVFLSCKWESILFKYFNCIVFFVCCPCVWSVCALGGYGPAPLTPQQGTRHQCLTVLLTHFPLFTNHHHMHTLAHFSRWAHFFFGSFSLTTNHQWCSRVGLSSHVSQYIQCALSPVICIVLNVTRDYWHGDYFKETATGFWDADWLHITHLIIWRSLDRCPVNASS